MKVAIEARALAFAASGVRTYTRELITHLIRGAGGDEYTILHSSADSMGTFASATEHLVSLRHKALFPWWLQHQVPAALKKIKPDVVHFTKADVPTHKQYPTVVTVYDVIPLLFPESQSVGRRYYWPRAFHRAAKYSDHILTISEASKRDIIEQLQVAPDTITVTQLGIDRQYFQRPSDATIQSFRNHYGLAAPYVLFVGTRDTRKNVVALVRAYDKVAHDLPHHLVVTGGRAFKNDIAIQELARATHRDRIHFLERTPQADLPALYAAADLFVCPSVYEGWSLPSLEAMACGTPVIVSNGGALPEVVGDAGVVVPFAVEKIAERTSDKEFEERLARAMHTVLSDSAEQQSLREAGLARVAQLSWDSVAKKAHEVYERVVL